MSAWLNSGTQRIVWRDEKDLKEIHQKSTSKIYSNFGKVMVSPERSADFDDLAWDPCDCLGNREGSSHENTRNQWR